MSEQGALFGITVPPGVRLGDRQWLALNAIAVEPRTSFQLGTAAHRKRGCDYCMAGLECFYAETEGAQIGASLRSHGLVRFSRKLGVWWLVEHGPPTPPSPQVGGEIPY